MSRFLPQPDPSRSPQLGGDAPAWCLWGTSIEVSQDLSQAPGALVRANGRVVNHQSPEYRVLVVQLVGADFPAAPDPIVPLASVKITTGVSGATFERVVQVGPVGVAVSLPAGRIYADLVSYNNLPGCRLQARLSHGLAIPGGWLETYFVPAGGQIFIPAQPFAQAVAIQQVTTGTVAYEVVPWLTATVVGNGNFGTSIPQITRGIEATETGGLVGANLLVQWQTGGG